MNTQQTIQQLHAAYQLLLQVQTNAPVAGIQDAALQAAVQTVVEAAGIAEDCSSKNAAFFADQAYYGLQDMVSRQLLQQELDLKAEDGKIAVIRHNSVDCDGVAMKDSHKVIPANVEAYRQHCEEISRNADGHYRLSMCPPSLACAV